MMHQIAILELYNMHNNFKFNVIFMAIITKKDCFGREEVF